MHTEISNVKFRISNNLLKNKINDSIISILSKYYSGDIFNAIFNLHLLKNDIFANGKFLDIFCFHEHFVDFSVDNGMWVFINCMIKRGYVAEKDLVAIRYIFDDLKDCFNKGEVFSDIIVG